MKKVIENSNARQSYKKTRASLEIRKFLIYKILKMVRADINILFYFRALQKHESQFATGPQFTLDRVLKSHFTQPQAGIKCMGYYVPESPSSPKCVNSSSVVGTQNGSSWRV